MFDLEQLHKVEIEILDEIDRVCKKRGLKYCLVGGTLLGAIRHNGFIPWDDDLDVAMPREDYDEFVRFCQNDLSDDFYLHDINSDESYWLPFVKVVKKYTLFDEKNTAGLNCKTGIYVDVFPLDDAKEVKSFGKQLCTRMIKEINLIYLYKIGYHKTHKIRTARRLIFTVLSLLTTKKWHKIQTIFMKRYSGASAEYYVNYASNYCPIKQTMPKKVYEPFSEVVFEGKKYPAPADTDYYLSRIYGANYMELPPIEKRVTHNPNRIVFDTRKETANQ